MRFRVAGVLTGLWLVVIGWYVYSVWPSPESLSTGDLGNVLSAVFAPLAFLWLVVGYFEQAEALRQNTEALRMQAHQLELQVQGTRSLALVAVRQTEATLRLVQLERKKFEEDAKTRIRVAQPRFVLDKGMRHPRTGSIRLHNVGAPASNLAVVTVAPIKASIDPAAHVQSGGFVNVEFEAPDFALVQAQIEYSDAQGTRRQVALNWTGDKLEIGAPNLEESV